MPTIIRVAHRRDPYVVIDRRALEDARLSWAARGLLGYLLAKPDDWTLRISDLRKRGDLGRDALYKQLKLLERVGYVKRTLTRDPKGHVTGVEYLVFEVPEALFPEKPESATPDTAQPYPAKPTVLSNHHTKEPSDQVTTTTTTTRTTAAKREEPSRGGGRGLSFPKSLSQQELVAAKRKLDELPPVLAQQLIDELAGHLQANTIRGSPLAYLRGLVNRAKAGQFTPEVGVAVAEARERRQRTNRALKRTPARLPELRPANKNDPLVQRAERIRARAMAAQYEDDASHSRKERGSP